MSPIEALYQSLANLHLYCDLVLSLFGCLAEYLCAFSVPLVYFRDYITSSSLDNGGRQARAQTFWGAGAQTQKKGHPMPKKNSDRVEALAAINW